LQLLQPLLEPGRSLSTSVGAVVGIGPGRGAALLVAGAGAVTGLMRVASVGLLVVVGAAALGVVASRARTGRTEWQRVWQLPLVSLVLGAIVFYGLLPLRFSGADTPMRSSGGGSGHYMSVSLQPNALTFLLVGIVAAIISVLAEMLPLWAYSSFPAVLQLAGGKKASAAWLAGTSGVAPTSSAQQWAYSTDPATGRTQIINVRHS